MMIDSHQHFWRFNPVKDKWITEEMSLLKTDFMPADLEPILLANGMEGCVAVQADQSERETLFLLDLSDQYAFIKGVVGWTDLRHERMEEQLEKYSRFKALKGFRHIVQAEVDDEFLLRDDFCRGISMLSRYNFTYDILISPQQIRCAVEFSKRFPNQPFVIDHAACPDIKEQSFYEWKKDLAAFASLDHVSCKISGLVTEAHWKRWQYEDFGRYIETVLEIFGIDRVMFGSDWPVCLVGGTYTEVCEILRRNTQNLTGGEYDKLWGGNCAKFYKL